jgi:hypothetical protein
MHRPTQTGTASTCIPFSIPRPHLSVAHKATPSPAIGTLIFLGAASKALAKRRYHNHGEHRRHRHGHYPYYQPQSKGLGPKERVDAEKEGA